MKETEARKIQHLDICLREAVETGSPLFEEVHLVHEALPEIHVDRIDPSCEFLGKRLRLPLIVAGMTGGCEEAGRINHALATVAEEKGLAMGVGSQRAMIERPELARTFAVRSVAPTVPLLGNIGLTALRKYPPDRIAWAVQSIGADGLCVHLNPAQEIFQPEGDRDFAACLPALESLCASVSFPVIAKEVGSGISRKTAERLRDAGVWAIDVGGAGGTNWILIDSLRAGVDPGPFRNWGIPTAAAILEARVGLPVIATGGVRDGLHMAKAIALGADLCGIALPFLRAFDQGGLPALRSLVDSLERGLVHAMLLTGSRNVAQLRKASVVLGNKLKTWSDQRGLLDRTGSR